MMIFTAKVPKRRLLAAALALAAALFVVLFLAVRASTPPAGEQSAEAAAATNEERIAFLGSFGWTVDTEPVESQEVLIPDEASDAFDRYNRLQQNQGYDLTDYSGKRVKRYVYQVTNYPDPAQTMYATLLVYHDKVVGGDLTAAAQDGPIQGFAQES